MDSSTSSLNSVGEATEALKSLLKVGKSAGIHGSTDTSINGNSKKESIEYVRTPSSSHTSSNGDVLAELLKMAKQPNSSKQQIMLTGDDVENSFSIYSSDVQVIASEGSGSSELAAGSNKVKTTSVVNFDWEHKLYYGNLVAVHKNGVHVAYVLKGKMGGVVRVINNRTSERALLKGFSGRVMDIAFAHIMPIVLGAVDQAGNMFIYEILEEKNGKINTELLLNIRRPEESNVEHRLIWCPYLPEDDEPSSATGTSDSAIDDVGKLLVLTHGDTAEMWNVDIVLREHDEISMIYDEVQEGYLVINSHNGAITDACYSPDGSALATASLDGYVKFFQVYLHDKNPPRCIHQWKPHEGRPVTSLFFLDDQKNPSPDVQFWKFAVTGASNNQEIKIWACETWSCLQTLTFLPSPLSSFSSPGYPRPPVIKAALDLSANYLIMSDINRKVVYVLQLFRDSEASRAHASSISEFLLTQPCLSVAVVEATRKKFRKLADSLQLLADLTSGEVGQEEDMEILDSHTTDVGVFVRAFSVHTKVLQELQIRFKPESSVPLGSACSSSLSTLGHVDLAVRDQLSDLSLDASMSSERDLPVRTPVSSAAYSTERSRSFEEHLTTSVATSGGGASARSSYEGQGQLHSVGSSRSYEGSPASRPGGLGQGLAGRPPAPTLIPPDAYTSNTSPRKEPREVALTMDSARSSATVQSNLSNFSDLTQVTGMDEPDDTLRSARGPGTMVAPQSPTDSSVTMTPASSHDLSVYGRTSANDDSKLTLSMQDTPSSVPLPPPTPGEESALVTPPAYRLNSSGIKLETSPRVSGGYSSSTNQKHVSGDVTGTPRYTHSKEASGKHHLGASHLQEFATSSPSRNTRGDFKPPTSLSQDDEDHNLTGVVAPVATAEEFIDTASGNSPGDGVSHRSTGSQGLNRLHSANSSSSTTSLEVSEIMEGGAKKSDTYYQQENEEDEDKEQDSDDEVNAEEPEVHKSEPEAEESVAEEIEEVIEAEEEEEEDEEEGEEDEEEGEEDEEEGEEEEADSSPNQVNTSGLIYDMQSWPAPPAVHDEAKRMASEAIHRAVTYTIENTGGGLYTGAECGDDDDVQVEEETEETAAEAAENMDEDANDAQVEEDEELDGDYGTSGTITVSSAGTRPHFGISDLDTRPEECEEGVGKVAQVAKERHVVSGRRLPKNDPSLEDLSYSTSMSSPTRLIPQRSGNTAGGEPSLLYVTAAAAAADMERMDQLQGSVQQLLNLLQSQQKDIEQLRDEIQQNRSAQETLTGLQAQIDSLEGLVTHKVSETLARHSNTESLRLKEVLGQRESLDHRKLETLVSNVGQNLERTIASKLERSVRDEIKNHVLPKIGELIQPIKQDLHKEVAQKLTATDSLVKDNIAKLIRSRQTVEAMGTAAGNALQGPVTGACRDVLIPAFDRACGNMFQQLNTSFHQGTHEYVQQLETHLEQVRRRLDQSLDPVVQQLSNMADMLRAYHEKTSEPTQAELRELCGRLQAQIQQQCDLQTRMEAVIHQAVYGLQDNLLREMKSVIQNEVVKTVKDQQAALSALITDAMRSVTATPLPQTAMSPEPEQTKTQVLSLLRQGQVNSAFQTALSASDLNLVMFVCDSVNPSQIFNQSPCPLQQAVLLSLIQQLSADLMRHLVLKLKYIEEAVLNLDMSDKVIQDYAPTVLGQLCQKLSAYLQANPNDKHAKAMKMLLMASKSVLSP